MGPDSACPSQVRVQPVGAGDEVGGDVRQPQRHPGGGGKVGAGQAHSGPLLATVVEHGVARAKPGAGDGRPDRPPGARDGPARGRRDPLARSSRAARQRSAGPRRGERPGDPECRCRDCVRHLRLWSVGVGVTGRAPDQLAAVSVRHTGSTRFTRRPRRRAIRRPGLARPAHGSGAGSTPWTGLEWVAISRRSRVRCRAPPPRRGRRRGRGSSSPPRRRWPCRT